MLGVHLLVVLHVVSGSGNWWLVAQHSARKLRGRLGS